MILYAVLKYNTYTEVNEEEKEKFRIYVNGLFVGAYLRS